MSSTQHRDEYFLSRYLLLSSLKKGKPVLNGRGSDDLGVFKLSLKGGCDLKEKTLKEWVFAGRGGRNKRERGIANFIDVERSKPRCLSRRVSSID